MSDVDLYIMKFSPEVRQRLTTIRQTALHVFGDVDETLCHSLPAFAINGKVFMFYGAYKDHISIRVDDDWVDFLKAQFPQFHYTQYTITFGHKDAFPDDVVQVICELVKPSRSRTASHGTATP